MAGGPREPSMRAMRTHTKLFTAALVAMTLIPAASASAEVVPEGTGEPTYTNSAQNTQYFRVAVPQGTDDYRVTYSFYENSVLVTTATVNSVAAGVHWANWSGVRTLQHGNQYAICAQGAYSLPNDSLYFPDGPNSCAAGNNLGKRTSTTIDRSKPSLTTEIATGAAKTASTNMPVRIAFNDDVAGPYPANFLCVKAGRAADGCNDIFGYSAACSVPATGGKSTHMECTLPMPAGTPDGWVTVCARAADAAVPDVPGNSNQAGQAEQANLADPACDEIQLDRSTPPPAGGGSDSGAGAGSGGSAAGAAGQVAVKNGTLDDQAGAKGTTGVSGTDGALGLQVPAQVKRGKKLEGTVTAPAAGEATVTLMRGKKAAGSVRVTISAAGKAAFSLKTAKKLKAGSYTVELSFKPKKGAVQTLSQKLKVSAR